MVKGGWDRGSCYKSYLKTLYGCCVILVGLAKTVYICTVYDRI